jgi:hypothetical protein
LIILMVTLLRGQIEISCVSFEFSKRFWKHMTQAICYILQCFIHFNLFLRISLLKGVTECLCISSEPCDRFWWNSRNSNSIMWVLPLLSFIQCNLFWGSYYLIIKMHF